MKLLALLIAVAASLLPVAGQAAEPERLSADELKQLDVLLDHACRTAEPGTLCSRAAITLLDKIGHLNAGPWWAKEMPGP